MKSQTCDAREANTSVKAEVKEYNGTYLAVRFTVDVAGQAKLVFFIYTTETHVKVN